jgi:ubiquinone/menaquinone biosynthesis C-methylase UbiE
VPFLLAAGGVACIAAAVFVATMWSAAQWAWSGAYAGLFLILSAVLYVHTTRSGKFAVWRDLLGGLGLRGDEQVLDMGAGRGAVLMMAAKLLSRGRAVGVDLWRSSDQSGNTLQAALNNAEREGVRQRVELRTGDMTAMPFEDACFDVVLSALAIHNIKEREGRQRAVDEAVRVLRPGGRMLIADIQFAAEYAERLQELGMAEVRRRGLGWRYWYGGPWMATSLVTATKPE